MIWIWRPFGLIPCKNLILIRAIFFHVLHGLKLCKDIHYTIFKCLRTSNIVEETIEPVYLIGQDHHHEAWPIKKNIFWKIKIFKKLEFTENNRIF